MNPSNPSNRSGDPLPSPRTPSDLAPGERRVAAWMSVLRRPDAPPGLGERILDAAMTDAAMTDAVVAPRPVASRSPVFRSASAWALAAAALVLVGFGLGVLLRPSDQPRPEAAQFLVVDDPSVSPFHGLDTFDGLAVLPSADASARGGR